MVVDPTQPEKGVFTEFFKIPTSCSCSIVPDEKLDASEKLLDELMKPRNNKDKIEDIQKTTKRKKEIKKESSYANYDYNYDDGYFNAEETTTSQAGNNSRNFW